jgi:hypothetical protein
MAGRLRLGVFAMLSGCFLSALGCSDFATPAELDRVQMVALRAEPATIQAGGRARLDALIVGPAGVVQPQELLWSAIPTHTGLAAVGQVEQDNTGTWLVAPADANPDLATVELDATVDGAQLVGQKGVAVGAPEAIANPTLDPISVDGNSSEEVRLSPGTKVTLRAQLSPDPGENGQYAWYTTAGKIKLYRSQIAELEVSSDFVEGFLLAVGRDGQGGVAWRTVRVLPL